MAQTKTQTVEAYLASLGADQREALERVRRAIRAVAPRAEEGIRYGVPAFILGKPIAGYAAGRGHCAYYPMSGEIIEAFAADLEGYATSKGAIRFPTDEPLPASLIRKLVQARLSEIGAPAPLRRKAAGAKLPHEVAEVLRELQRKASESYRADMQTRYGIVTQAIVYGTPVSQLRRIAKQLGKSHALSRKLWQTGVHDARMLATMVADPAALTRAEMNRWAKDFDNWALVDTACFQLFDRTPHVFALVQQWARSKHEFVKRAAFALLASAALHGHGSDADHLRGLELIEGAASDPRNFVKKGVSWALRAIGSKRSPPLRKAARALAKKLAASSDATERWIGKDALRAFDRA